MNRPKLPEIAGRESIAGLSFHSARWNHAIDLRGKRVRVIGNGASADQGRRGKPSASAFYLDDAASGGQRTPAGWNRVLNHSI